jgi:hypothetical protein
LDKSDITLTVRTRALCVKNSIPSYAAVGLVERQTRLQKTKVNGKAMMQQLIGNEATEFLERQCIEVATDSSGWISLFQETLTKAYWVRNFPHSSSHGGGQPVISQISATEAKERFNA